jgi:hypothetical protein
VFTSGRCTLRGLAVLLIFRMGCFAQEGRYLGLLNAVCTSWIADSIGDMVRKGMWPGTRSERANLPATHRERTLLLTWCDSQCRIPRSPGWPS